ncbi:MAG: methyltransferase domain-containing protein [Burkholderia sp.]|nr:methyltransferase domain-containing protein [Burkholderia sp.]
MSSVPILPSKITYNTQSLRRIFDRRAAGFNAVTFLLREVSQRMDERFDYIKINPSNLLDAGCGMGDDLQVLNFRFPDTKVFGVDLSREMLARSGDKDVVQSDFSSLPFSWNTFDLIWSNLALQWNICPSMVLQEWQRVLRVSGLLMFSTLGPDTFRELRNSCLEADKAIGIVPSTPHVIDFVDMHDLGDMLLNSGFDFPVMDKELLIVTYKSPNSLLDDVKGWGAYPFYRTSPSKNRSFRLALESALDSCRSADGTIPLTFEIIYGHGWKTVPYKINEEHELTQIKDIGKANKSPSNIRSNIDN